MGADTASGALGVARATRHPETRVNGWVLREVAGQWDDSLRGCAAERWPTGNFVICLCYTSDAADDLHCAEHGGRRTITKKNKQLTYSRGA